MNRSEEERFEYFLFRQNNKEIDSDGPICPGCGFQFTPDESFYYDPSRYHEDTCPECGCTFDVEVETETVWRTFKRFPAYWGA